MTARNSQHIDPHVKRRDYETNDDIFKPYIHTIEREKVCGAEWGGMGRNEAREEPLLSETLCHVLRRAV